MCMPTQLNGHATLSKTRAGPVCCHIGRATPLDLITAPQGLGFHVTLRFRPLNLVVLSLDSSDNAGSTHTKAAEHSYLLLR